MRAKSQQLAFLLALIVCLGTALSAAELPEKLQQLSRKYLETAAPADRENLAAYVAQIKSAEVAGLGHLALGAGDYFARQYDSAAAELKQAPDDAAHLGDYARYYRAKSLVEVANFADAASVLADYPTSYPGSRLLQASIRVRAESLIRAEHPEQAREVLEASRKALSEPVRQFLLGRVEEIGGNLPAAVEAYRLVYYGYPLSDQIPDAEARLNDLRAQLGASFRDASPDTRFRRAEALFDAGRYSDAYKDYQAAIPGLQGKNLDRARVGLGACDYQRLKTTNAAAYLTALNVTDPEAQAQRLYYLIQCARRKDQPKEFERRLKEMAQKFPQSKWRDDALFSLGNYYLLENDTRNYGKYYEQVARLFPKSDHAPLAHWKICWRAYLEKDPRVRDLMEEHLALYPLSEQTTSAAYWLGRIAEKNNDASLARQIYAGLDRRFPHYYYSLLARHRLADLGAPEGVESPAVAELFRKVGSPRKLSEEMDASTSRSVQRGHLLFQLGLNDDAEKELLTADYRGSDAHFVGLELYRQTSANDAYYRGLRYMKRYAFGYLRMPLDSMPRNFWESLFPLPYGESLVARAAPHALDPYLVAGLIRQESEFNPRATSRAGAMGLMQIMPATGKGLARRAGIASFSASQLFTPDTSLQLGTMHLREVFDRNQNELEISLAAYNAGENRAAQWLQWGDFDEPGKFVETIPFTETRGYVQSVLRNADVYRRLYGDNAQQPSVATLEDKHPNR